MKNTMDIMSLNFDDSGLTNLSFSEMESIDGGGWWSDHWDAFMRGFMSV